MSRDSKERCTKRCLAAALAIGCYLVMPSCAKSGDCTEFVEVFKARLGIVSSAPPEWALWNLGALANGGDLPVARWGNVTFTIDGEQLVSLREVRLGDFGVVDLPADLATGLSGPYGLDADYIELDDDARRSLYRLISQSEPCSKDVLKSLCAAESVRIISEFARPWISRRLAITGLSRLAAIVSDVDAKLAAGVASVAEALKEGERLVDTLENCAMEDRIIRCVVDYVPTSRDPRLPLDLREMCALLDRLPLAHWSKLADYWNSPAASKVVARDGKVRLLTLGEIVQRYANERGARTFANADEWIAFCKTLAR